tara:strand:+ start:812 stop:1519 length:708 start_codon:yes stop_codon:yes gene_type:complete
MKITAQTLKKLIKEEYASMLSEGRGPRDPEDPRQPYKPGGPFEVPRPEPYKPEDSVDDKIDPKDLKEQEAPVASEIPDISEIAQQGPQAVIAAVCGRLGDGGAEKIASFVKAFLANPNADIAGLLDKHLGAGHGMMANFLLKMEIEQAGGQTLEQLLVPLRAAFTAAQGFGGMIPGIKEAWEAAQQAALAVSLPLIKAGCSAAQAVPAGAEESRPMQEHVTKDLLKQLVKEQLAK